MQHLKNYTSAVPVSRTVARIEEALAAAGVQRIHKEYGPSGTLCALLFTVINEQSDHISVRLPVDVQAVKAVMRQAIKRPRPATLDRLQDQAARTAWKLMEDWTLVQLSLIRMKQAEWMQVFLPYVWDGERDYYHHLKAGQRKLLPGMPNENTNT